jgi:hypothetical protein
MPSPFLQSCFMNRYPFLFRVLQLYHMSGIPREEWGPLPSPPMGPDAWPDMNAACQERTSSLRRRLGSCLSPGHPPDWKRSELGTEPYAPMRGQLVKTGTQESRWLPAERTQRTGGGQLAAQSVRLAPENQ